MKIINYLTTLSIILVVLFTACPEEPDNELECGAHEIEVDGDCECEDGYHWNEDGTKCLLNTTSHNFVWEIDTLGGYGSYLNDVAIIDENNVLVVGNIETDTMEYNAAHWNGSEWELMGIYSNTLDLYSIHYFSEDDIWVTSHCFPLHWNGIEWTLYHLNNMGMPGVCVGEAIWGTAPSNLYFVGDNGSIVHYDGVSFNQMESGTDVDLLDIDGTPDGECVFAVGWNSTLPAPCVVLEMTNGIWNTLYYTEGSLPQDGNVGWVWGVGVLQDTVYLPSSAGLWKYNFVNQDSILINNTKSHMHQSAFKSVNVKSTNDIFFAGSGFKYIHFNGSTYYYSQEISDMYPQRALNGSDYNGNLVVMVGYFNWWEGALVVKGYHE